MDTLYIVIPAYNESENIKRTIEEWCPVVEKHNGGGASRLVIINDGSRDDTYEIASAECETHPLLTVLTKPNGDTSAALGSASMESTVGSSRHTDKNPINSAAAAGPTVP